LSVIVPLCNHACRGVQTSAVAIKSQTTSDKPPVATNKRWRLRRLIGHWAVCTAGKN
jgi:hypothetical protein